MVLGEGSKIMKKINENLISQSDNVSRIIKTVYPAWGTTQPFDK